MLVVGLTGNIGSGKSTVARELEKLGARVIDADAIARAVVEPGTPALEEIRQHFGTEVLNPDGSLNRARMAEIVFRDPDARAKLNSIVHPRVTEVLKSEVAAYREGRGDRAPVLVLEVPLLLEAGLEYLVDEIWVVTAPEEALLKRIMARDGVCRERARRRLNAQMPQAEKIRRAHRVIDNSGTPEETRSILQKLWQEVAVNK